MTKYIPSIDPKNIITKSSLPKAVDFKKGVLILVDKPLEWTSFDVVNKIRFAVKHRLGVKKIKVGHAGTLDPMATGLLLICVGKYTKSIETLTALNKSYTGQIKLGATTPSLDRESEESEHFPTEHIQEADIYHAAEAFTGIYNQTPPMYSAIKVKGEKLYTLARRGEEIERKKRSVHISEFSIPKINMPFVHFSVTCSKGTYIRSLAADFGAQLHSGGYLTELRRTSIDQYQVSEALDLEQLIHWIQKEVELQEDHETQ